MSSTLMWKPVKQEGESLSDNMKRVLREYMTGDQQGTLLPHDVAALKGMAIAGSTDLRKDCETLINAIEKYGAVEVWHEY